jgi:hypothetical protein
VLPCQRRRSRFFSINEESIAQMRKQHRLASAEGDDPVYKRTQRYQGLWLAGVLADLGRGGRPESDIYVRFRCKDGNLPIMPLTRGWPVIYRDTSLSQILEIAKEKADGIVSVFFRPATNEEINSES